MALARTIVSPWRALRRGLVGIVLAVLVGGLAGCVGVPQPEPPSLDPAGVTGIPGGRNTGQAYRVAEGSIDPPVGRLWVVGLDDDEDPQLLPVEPDGSVASFEVASPRLRVQVRDGEVRERPWDFERDGDAARRIDPAAPCLEAPLELEVGRVQVGGAVEARLTLANGCAEAVAIGRVAMRRASDFEVVLAPPSIDAGASGEILVRLTPQAEGLREEVLSIDHAGPAEGRRFVTLFGHGLP